MHGGSALSCPWALVPGPHAFCWHALAAPIGAREMRANADSESAKETTKQGSDGDVVDVLVHSKDCRRALEAIV